MDLQELKERLDLVSKVEEDLGPGKRSGRWVMFHCPFPGHKNGDRKPSLAVTPENGRFHCFSCGRSGDVLTWLQVYRGLSWPDIYDLGGTGISEIHGKHQPAKPLPELATPPSATWQARASAFVEACRERIWKPGGAEALEYLRGRCLNDETIRINRLGYNPADHWESFETWDLPDEPGSKGVWLPKGITIPAVVGGGMWYLKIRRVGSPGVKYIQPRGSKAALFGAENLTGSELVLLTEGEFDCMLADQEIGDVCGVATLGSGTKRLDLATWGSYLMPARAILAAYDSDRKSENGLAALVGLSRRIQSIRVPVLRPGDKDVTDYVKAGGDLWEWLKYHLARLGFLTALGITCEG